MIFHIRPYRPGDADAVYAAADESRGMIAKWMGWMTLDYSRQDAEGLQGLRLKVGDIAHDAHMYAFLNPAAIRPADTTKDPARLN